MRLTAIVLVLALTAGAAVANPVASSFYVQFNEPGGPNEMAPPALSEFSAYLVLLMPAVYPTIDCLGSISFAVDITPEMVVSQEFTNLLPSGLAIGDWETGISLASDPCGTDEIIPVARIDIVCTGLGGRIALLPHPDWPYWLSDCSSGVSYWQSMEEEGAWGTVLPAPDPVEPVSWTAVKALYR